MNDVKQIAMKDNLWKQYDHSKCMQNEVRETLQALRSSSNASSLGCFVLVGLLFASCEESPLSNLRKATHGNLGLLHDVTIWYDICDIGIVVEKQRLAVAVVDVKYLNIVCTLHYT